MGILQYLTQTKEALSGGFNELKNTSGGILRFLGNNVNKFEQKKEDFYEPVPNKVRTRDVIREATELAIPQPETKEQALQEMAFNTIPFGATTKAVKNVDKNIGKSLLNKVDDVVDPILQEARKYKSAEEFVKAQGTPLYHGTPQKIVGDKLTYRMKSGQDSGGIFLTDNRDIADVFSFKGKVYEVNPAIKSQVIDLTTPSGIDKVKSYIGKSYKTFEGETMIFTKGDFDIMFPNGKTDFASVSQYPELIQKIVKDNKMRGIAFYEYAGGKTGKTFQILEGDVPISK